MKTKSALLAIAGVAALTILVCVVLLMAPGAEPTPPITQPTEPPVVVEELDLISVYVYGDAFVVQKDGFVFDNPESNRHQLSFQIKWDDRVIFESDYIDPGTSVKWDTMQVDPGFYDCLITVSARDVETGEEGNRIFVRQIFYIDETAPLETHRLFRVSVPAKSYLEVKGGNVEITYNQIIVEKQTHEDGSPLPRTEAINIAPDAVMIGETLVQIGIGKVSADEDDLQYILELVVDKVDGQLKDGTNEGQFGFYFDWFSEENVLVP